MAGLRAIINAQFYLALTAMILCLETQVQLGEELSLHPYLFIVFFSTLLVYNFPKLAVLLGRSPLLLRQSMGFYALILSALVGLSVSLAAAHQNILILASALGVISLWYSIPFFTTKEKAITLRSIPYAKIFIISLVWSASTVLLPYAHPLYAKNFWAVLFIFAQRFFFIFAITLPFDIRDRALDKKMGLKTLPMLFDLKYVQMLSGSALLLSFLLACGHFMMTYSFSVLLALGISFSLTSIALFYKPLRSMPHYHEILLDGCMLLQGLLVIGFYYRA